MEYLAGSLYNLYVLAFCWCHSVKSATPYCAAPFWALRRAKQLFMIAVILHWRPVSFWCFVESKYQPCFVGMPNMRIQYPHVTPCKKDCVCQSADEMNEIKRNTGKFVFFSLRCNRNHNILCRRTTRMLDSTWLGYYFLQNRLMAKIKHASCQNMFNLGWDGILLVLTFYCIRLTVK